MSEKVWRTVPGLDFETAYWGEQFILFNRLSGDTHLLNQPIDWLLEQIGSGPRSLSELIGIATDAGMVCETDDNYGIFARLLDDLEKIDLLEPVRAV